MYRALYRKWRPRTFGDVVGQADITTALKNQILHDRIGHAYLFTGTRGTGKTTCARIFAKAINCREGTDGEPCGECPICTGIDDGSVTDIVEIDAASNTGVNDIRDLRDETVYMPGMCTYKVYIIDEVHMLSTAAFNALLKIVEEPPPYVIFILATTEIRKVPATILSRCQRYDFSRIPPEEIEKRLLYVAEQESIALEQQAAALIARLADGAMRDALSILDTCAGVSGEVDEALVRRMAGVTDKSYLFEISDAAAAGDVGKAIALSASLQARSVDVRRLCSELIFHYRNCMLACVPDGRRLLTGVSPEEEQRYMEKAGTVPQREAIRAIRCLSEAFDRMGKGADARVEMELALFALCEPEPVPAAPAVPQAAVPPVQKPPAPPAARQTVQPFAAAPAPAAAVPAEETPPAEKTETAPASAPAPQPAELPAQSEEAPQPTRAAPARPIDPPQPFAPWEKVVAALETRGPMLYANLRNSSAYFDGRRVLIDGSPLFIEYMRRDEAAGQLIKQAILEVTGMSCGIGPYKKRKEENEKNLTAEDTLHYMETQGVDVRYINE